MIICLRPWSCRDFTIIREKIQSAATVFLVSQERQQQQQQLITKDGFNILCTGFTMGYKTGQKIFPGGRPKPPLHGLSLSKSPIKKSRNIIRVRSDCQLDQTQLGFTKPNTLCAWSCLAYKQTLIFTPLLPSPTAQTNSHMRYYPTTLLFSSSLFYFYYKL